MGEATLSFPGIRQTRELIATSRTVATCDCMGERDYARFRGSHLLEILIRCPEQTGDRRGDLT